MADLTCRDRRALPEPRAKRTTEAGDDIHLILRRNRAPRDERIIGVRVHRVLGHKGRGEDVYSGLVERSWEPRNYGQQYPARPNRYGFESCLGRLGGPAESSHST